MKTGTYILVRWNDTVTDPKWMDQKEFQTKKATSCITVGIYVGQDKDVIRLAHSITNDDQCDGTVIPLGCVSKMEVLTCQKQCTGHSRLRRRRND